MNKALPIRREDVNEKRYWPKVDKSGPIPEHRPDLGPCWLWKAYIQRDGYGVFAIGRKAKLAHRVALALSGCELSPDLEVDHLCRNRGCVNPSHLEQVTCLANVLRGVSFAAVNAWRTHCRNGHAFVGDNLKSMKNGTRLCLTCRGDWDRSESTRQSARVRDRLRYSSPKRQVYFAGRTAKRRAARAAAVAQAQVP